MPCRCGAAAPLALSNRDRLSRRRLADGGDPLKPPAAGLALQSDGPVLAGPKIGFLDSEVGGTYFRLTGTTVAASLITVRRRPLPACGRAHTTAPYWQSHQVFEKRRSSRPRRRWPPSTMTCPCTSSPRSSSLSVPISPRANLRARARTRLPSLRIPALARLQRRFAYSRRTCLHSSRLPGWR